MSDKYKNFLVKYSHWLLGIVTFVVYLFTLAPSVIQIDSGELAAVQSTLGIAHPTGYPLFTIIGYLFLLIPLPFSEIYRTNQLAAVWCSLGIVLFVKSMHLVLNEFATNNDISKKLKTKKLKIIQPGNKNAFLHVTLPSIAAGVILAFSKTYWTQSTSVEVYSLQIFLFMLIIFTTLKAYFSTKNTIKDWVWVALAFAMGFANHMTTILLIPFTGILFFGKEGFSKFTYKKLLVAFISFVPSVIFFYLYFPLRASASPRINWGNPVNFENLFRHITGKQYQVWLFSSFDSAKKQFSYYVENLPTEFAVVGIIMAFIGIISIYKKSIKIFLPLFITFLFSVFYSINYDISDINSYFLTSYIMLSIFCSFGFLRLIEYGQKKNINNKIILFLNILVISIPLISNYANVDQHNQYIFEDYTKEILNGVEENSIIFSYQWDYFISASYYFQLVENFRKDVAVIDKELLRRSWYYNQINKNHPEILRGLKTEIDNFLIAVKPFERSENFDPVILEKYYRAIMTKLISENPDRNFYIGIELVKNEMERREFSLPDGYKIIPHKYLFKVVKNSEYVTVQSNIISIRKPKRPNKYTDFIISTISDMIINRAYYELSFGKTVEAKTIIRELKKFNPEVILPENLISL